MFVFHHNNEPVWIRIRTECITESFWIRMEPKTDPHYDVYGYTSLIFLRT